MFYLISLVIFFVIISAIILLTPPDRMAEEEKFRPKLRDIGPAVTLCKTAVFGRPKIRLLPPNQEVTLNLEFSTPDLVKLSVPLRQVRQQIAKSRYLDVFAEHGLAVEEHINSQNQMVLSANLNRSDESLTDTIISIYKTLFEAKDHHAVNLYVSTLKLDSNAFLAFRDRNQFHSDHEYKSVSTSFEGKSIRTILFSRIIETGNVLLYPVTIILSFMNFGVIGMCWAALVFFMVVLSARFLSRKTLSNKYGFRSLSYLGLIGATLLTGKSEWIKLAPSVFGVIIALDGAAQILGFRKNRLEFSNDNRWAGKVSQTVMIIIGLALFLFNEWARRTMNLDSWVWFFGFVRFELMILAALLLAPAFALFSSLLQPNETSR